MAMTLNYACSRCGHRQDDNTKCGGCGYDALCDLEKPRDVDYLRGIERKELAQRDDRIRKGAVAIAMAIVISFWFVPLYRQLRGLFALPLFIDQLVIVVVIAGGIWKLLERAYRGKRRFPWLDT